MNTSNDERVCEQCGTVLVDAADFENGIFRKNVDLICPNFFDNKVHSMILWPGPVEFSLTLSFDDDEKK